MRDFLYMMSETHNNLAAEFPVSASRVAWRAAAILLTYGALVMLGHALWPSWLVLLPTVCCGFILSGFLNAAHDCVHLRHTGVKQVDRYLGMAWCTPILVNYTLYKAQHLVHHRHTGVAGDPEPDTHFNTVAEYFYEMSAIGFWQSIFSRIVKTLRGDFPASLSSDKLKSMARADNLVLCAYLVTVVVLTLVFPMTLLFAVWLPLLFYPVFAIALSLPEHYGLRASSGTAEKSRNVGSNRLLRFFQWNANFHAAHHRAPNVPSIWLDRFYRQTTPTDSEEYRSGYVRFHRDVLAHIMRARSAPPHESSGR